MGTNASRSRRTNARRANFRITTVCDELLNIMADRLGVTRSAILEQSVRSFAAQHDVSLPALEARPPARQPDRTAA